MLIELAIQNFTIINRCTLELTAHMTVLTGETGAGKSILVDALSFVLGGRADTKFIRHEAQQADISASFIVEANSESAQWLKEHDFSEAECVLRRVLNREGRSKAYINGHPCTLQQLKILGSTLVNIHGQHEHYALLKRDNQLARLDYYAGHADKLAEVRHTYKALKHSERELLELQAMQQAHHARQELLHYQIEELQQLALSEHELQSLHQEQQKLAHAQELMHLCAGALDTLYENEQSTLLSQLNAVYKPLLEAGRIHKEMHNIAQMLSDAILNVKECAHELKDYYEGLSLEPERLQAVEQRLQDIYTLARKHKVSPEALYQHHQALMAEQHGMSHLNADIKHLEQHCEQLHTRYQKLATQLTVSRHTAAATLSHEVSQSMQALGMEGGQFNIEFDTTEGSDTGLDRITFTVSPNPGQPLRPMSDVVSGGELSRIGLAIQVLTAAKSATPTLIFDEVDVGIGGATAEVVGTLLRKLGEHCQVVCVTHLPQVAAQAQHHIFVKKHKQIDNTESQLTQLNVEGRQQELARMLGGVHISEQTLNTAAEMLARAR